ncbi:MAG TPA: hypothetical protein P5065_01935 [Candidatus Ratteibacteria bacterium]|nr:hypothetical protein [bacterium]HRS05788.1 hypothetical protein [Candidatus Ratteibacteria bacterium]HRV03832.1 hypothetical protein [Candidatus Ratteibacteria bacterium]
MAEKQKERIFSDIPSLISGGFTPAKGTGAGWIPFNYEFDDFSGKGIATGARSPAGEIVLDLKITGQHRLYIAFNPSIRIWLDGDTGYYQHNASPHDVRDYFCFENDFTGKKLHIAPVRGNFSNKELIIFYIRVVPCGTYNSTKNLIATNDGHGVFCAGLDSYRDLYRYLLPLKDSDFFRIIWGVYGGGLLNVKNSKVADKLPFPDDVNFYEHEWFFNRSIENILKQEYDPLLLVREAAEKIGIEIHFYFRIGAFYWPFPHQGKTSKFFLENPKLHCIDEYGNKVKRISYAFPEVQNRILEYFEELLQYNPDGICLAFNRGLPLMICEQPIIDEFEKTYGRRPKLPEEVDSPEILKIRHNLLAEFVGKVHKLVSSHGKVLSCIIPRDLNKNLLFGLDVELLAKNGFLESVLVGAGHKDNPELNSKLEDLEGLKKLGIKIYPGGSGVNAHGGAWKPNDNLARTSFMAKILDTGFDGAYFWDIDQIVESGTEWEILRQFGHKEILNKILNGKMPEIKYHYTRKIYDLTVDRYNPWNAY